MTDLSTPVVLVYNMGFQILLRNESEGKPVCIYVDSASKQTHVVFIALMKM